MYKNVVEVTLYLQSEFQELQGMLKIAGRGLTEFSYAYTYLGYLGYIPRICL